MTKGQMNLFEQVKISLISVQIENVRTGKMKWIDLPLSDEELEKQIQSIQDFPDDEIQIVDWDFDIELSESFDIENVDLEDLNEFAKLLELDKILVQQLTHISKNLDEFFINYEKYENGKIEFFPYTDLEDIQDLYLEDMVDDKEIRSISKFIDWKKFTQFLNKEGFIETPHGTFYID